MNHHHFHTGDGSTHGSPRDGILGDRCVDHSFLPKPFQETPGGIADIPGAFDTLPDEKD